MAATTFDNSNPQQLIYSSPYLILTVLGGIRLDGLDRLRVTLKAELPDNPRPPIRHNLDLYNDTQVEKLVRKTAERLEIGTSVIAASLAELTEQLEIYRLEEIKNKQPEGIQKKVLSEKEREQAETFLRSKNLLEKTNELIGKSGLIGETVNRLLMYLIFTSRKRQTPLHVISLASSGTGKSYLQEKVSELIPEEDRLEQTTLSENALYYFGQTELKNKLILIEDLDGADTVLYPLRELQSKKKITKTITKKDNQGNNKTITVTVEGPVSVAGCTTQESIYEDNANRSFLLYLDESKEQDEKIMNYQRALSAGKVDTAAENQIKELLKNTQRILQPITVKNPYAELLKIPSEVFKPRRTNAHYLQFIEAITFYHQYQREQKVNEATGEVFIETTIEDIQSANTLLKEILLRKSDELTGACRNYIERLKKWLQDESKTAFTNAQARTALRENHSNQKRYMLQLQEAGLIRKTKGDKKKGFYYEVVSMEDYQKLQDQITSVLDEVLQKLPQVVGSSQEVQHGSEPLKPNSSKGKAKKFTKTEKQHHEEIKTA